MLIPSLLPAPSESFSVIYTPFLPLSMHPPERLLNPEMNRKKAIANSAGMANGHAVPRLCPGLEWHSRCKSLEGGKTVGAFLAMRWKCWTRPSLPLLFGRSSRLWNALLLVLRNRAHGLQFRSASSFQRDINSSRLLSPGSPLSVPARVSSKLNGRATSTFIS
jgi:hypothetical protein